MDIKSLKKKSDLMHDIAVSKKYALEKMHSRQIVAYMEDYSVLMLKL